MNENDSKPAFQRFVENVLLSIGVMAAILLLILAFIEITPVKVEWVRGFFTLMGVCAGGSIALYGVLEGFREHRERERRDRLVKIKREAYNGIARAVSRMSWAMATYWGEKDPTRDPEMVDTSFDILSLHFVGSIDNIQRLGAALDYYNASIVAGRPLRQEIEKAQADCNILANRKKLFEDRYLSVILSNPPATTLDGKKKQAEELKHYLDSTDIVVADLKTAFERLQTARITLLQFIEPRRFHFLWLASQVVPSARIESELAQDFDATRYADIYKGFELKPKAEQQP